MSSRGGRTLSGAASGAAAGAGIGSVIPGVGTGIGAGVGAVVGGIGGFLSDDEDAKARKRAQKALEARQRARQRMMLDFLKQADSGRQSMLTARRQEIDRRHQDVSSTMLRDASRRGLVHSGYAGAMSRDLERERQGALTQAEGEAQAYLLQALQQAMQLQEYGLQDEAGIQQMIFAARNAGDDDLVNALTRLAPTLGNFMQERSMRPTRFQMVSD